MTNMLRRRQPPSANGSPIASMPQTQDSALRLSLLQLQTVSLYNTIVSIAWLVAFIVLIRALAGVGYAGNLVKK